MLKQLENILKSEIDPAFAKRAEFLFQTIEERKPKKVLDAGCGRGFYVQALSYFSFIKEIQGIDVNEKYLAIAKRTCTDLRCRVRKASIYRLPYPNEYFDCVICSEVLEHLNDDNKALLEIKRVLKKNGLLFVTVPNKNFPFFWDPLNWILMKVFKTHVDKNIWWLAGIWADHERLYAEKQLKILITNCGFRIKETRNIISWCWPFSHFLLYGIGKNFIELFGFSELSRFSYKENKGFDKILA
ncbi:class I SAM-dependent methyltransferase, partial [Candidatus Roizmanbacteria bacterium]|nr:class I SAM-dependent methyltransferase [Candidatus Roizmanbacteria bacterium]